MVRQCLGDKLAKTVNQADRMKVVNTICIRLLPQQDQVCLVYQIKSDSLCHFQNFYFFPPIL
jgi:hypothetical protein